ncbi:MAG TPA: DoxX family membrane protein [bacterium]|nr:DoxX family membrane protein [bacterium]HPR89197.1 DoxX family membrane protein [bacterium]
MKETRLSGLQWTLLTALRMVIGWHYLYEGVAKLIKGNWSAYGFLMESKWILAGFFHSLAGNSAVLAVVNTLNIWGLILIGLGLILGLFTRLAAGAGILLILLYYVCNPPFVGLFYSIPMEGHYLFINKNLVELTALLVLSVIPTQQVAGLDRLLYKLWKK